MIANIFN